jgi:hypothetical protein
MHKEPKMKQFLPRLAAAAALLASSTVTLAHDGHGLAGSHWHPTDTAGFAVVALLAGMAIWLSRDR